MYNHFPFPSALTELNGCEEIVKWKIASLILQIMCHMTKIDNRLTHTYINTHTRTHTQAQAYQQQNRKFKQIKHTKIMQTYRFH